MASDPPTLGWAAGPFSTSNRFFSIFVSGPFLDPLFFSPPLPPSGRKYGILWGKTGSYFLSGSAASSNPRPVQTLKPLFLHMFQALGAFPKTSFWRSKSSQNWYHNWSKNETLFSIIFFAGLGRKRPFQGKKWAPIFKSMLALKSLKMEGR